MIVFYKSVLGDYPHVEISGMSFCCARMEDIWDNTNVIGFSDWWEYTQQDCYVNIYDVYSWTHDNIRINYCPFCGDPIETKEIKKRIV